MNDDQTIEYYQKRAGEYEKIYFRDNPARQSELAEMYALSRRVLADRQVLDLACGTGFWTRIVSEQARSVTAIDINPAMLTEAGKKRYHVPIHFVRADYFYPPFLSARFDALLASFVVSHIRRQEINRLRDVVRQTVRPGSPAFLCDNNLICEIIPELIWDEEHINSYKTRRLENGEEYVILKNYFDRRELESLFQSWGRIEQIMFKDYYWAVVLTVR